MRLSAFALMLLASGALYTTARDNYVSKVWNPDRGDGTYVNPIINADYSDPDAIRVGSDYWMTASSFCNVPGLPILHSTDLVNWEIVNHALPALPSPTFDTPQHGKGVWAPSIRFHNGEYYIFWGDPDTGAYMVKTADPRGKWSEPVLLWRGKGIIDTCPLWDEDGKAYLVNAWAKSRSGFNSMVTVSEMRPDATALLSEPVMVYDGMPEGNHTIEGPKFYKRNGYYYILAPAGGVEQGWQMALRSRNPFGPYESKIVMAEGKSGINGPHQGAWIDTDKGENWFINFQDKGFMGRVLHLNPMEWRGDWPLIGIDKDGDGCGEPVARHRKPKVSGASQRINPAESDSFDSVRLGEQWDWFANYRPEFGFTTPLGYFRLYGHNVSGIDGKHEYVNLREVPNLLTQKLPADQFTATAETTISGSADGQQAGIVVMGRDYSRMAVEKKGDRFIIKQIESFGADLGNGETETVVAEVAASRLNCDGPAATSDLDIWMRVRLDGKGMAHFSYSLDGKKFIPSGKPFKVRQGHWIGARVGFAALQRGKDRGWLDIRSFTVEP